MIDTNTNDANNDNLIANFFHAMPKRLQEIMDKASPEQVRGVIKLFEMLPDEVMGQHDWQMIHDEDDGRLGFILKAIPNWILMVEPDGNIHRSLFPRWSDIKWFSDGKKHYQTLMG
jgi:hypothetical protein